MIRRHWYKPSFWRWWWHNEVGPGPKLLLGLVAVAFLLGGGYWFAGRIETSQAVVYTERMVTVTRTVVVKGKPRVITEVRTITTQGVPRIKTVRRNGKTVYVTTPGETIVSTRTVRGPVRKSVVYKDRMITKVIPGKVRTITLPGKTLPGSTVTGPERVVTITGPSQTVTTTAPGETINREVIRNVTGPTQTVTGPTQTVTGPTHTVTGPTQTQTQTVTGPTTTVTGPTITITGPTQTVTHTVTETEIVTVTHPPKP